METFECSLCRDEEFVAETEDGTRYPLGHPDLLVEIDKRVQWVEYTVVPCECAAEKRIKRHFRSSQIPARYTTATLDNFITRGKPLAVQRAHEIAQDYVNRFDDIKDTPENSMLLIGAPDTGKTHLLMAVANTLLKRGYSVLYCPWVEWLDELKGNFDELNNKMRLMAECDVLYLDDLYKGREVPTGWAKERIYAIINQRYNEHKPFLVSTEHGPVSLQDIDLGIARRMLEPSKGHRVFMNLTKDEEESGSILRHTAWLQAKNNQSR